MNTRDNSQYLVLYGTHFFKAVWLADEYTMEPYSPELIECGCVVPTFGVAICGALL